MRRTDWTTGYVIPACVLAMLVAVVSGCGKITLKDGAYVCTQGEPNTCPSGWVCLPEPGGSEYRCYREANLDAAVDGEVDGSVDADVQQDGGPDGFVGADAAVDAHLTDSAVNDGALTDGPTPDRWYEDSGQNNNNNNANSNDTDAGVNSNNNAKSNGFL